MSAVAKHHSRSPDYFSWFFAPAPVWKKLYLMVMNERETFLMYPNASYEWWLRHDNWTVSELASKPKPMLRWKTQSFMERADIRYDEIGLLDELEFHYLRKRRNRTKMQALQVAKHHFLKTFELTSADTSMLWGLFMEHPTWVHNTRTERFSDCDKVIQRRWGKLLQTQRNTEWLDMAGARLVIIQKLTRKLGLPELWNANDKTISPASMGKAEKWVEENQKQIRLAFGSKRTVKTLLSGWAGHKLKVEKRIRKIERNAEYPPISCSMGEFVDAMGSRMYEYENMYGPRVLRENVRAFLRKVHTKRGNENATAGLDESIRTIQSLPWHLLRNPGIST